MKIFENFFGKNIFSKKCDHDLKIVMKIEDATLTEPDKESTDIKIKMVYTSCPKCDKMFKVTPLGVVHDPAKGVIMDANQKMEDEADIPEEEKKMMLKEFKKEGIL